MCPFENSFAGSSAIFHAVKGLIFNRKKLTFQITYVIPDENNRNLKIHNEERLKNRLFHRIQTDYSRRINHADYQMTLPGLTDARINDLILKKFKLTHGKFGSESELDYGGTFQIFPRSFACKECGNLYIIGGPEFKNRLKNFDIKCKNPSCDGEYEQISVMHYCETCGNIRQLEWSCKNHPVKLRRGSKDSLATYEVSCQKNGCKNYNNWVSIFMFWCEHKDQIDWGNIISNAEKKKPIPLTVTEGAIFLPVTDSSIDIPHSDNINLEDLEYILLGLFLKKFHEQLSDESISLEKLHTYIERYNDEAMRNVMFTEWPEFSELSSDEERERSWRERWNMPRIESVVNELKNKYRSIEQIREINDFAALIGGLNAESSQNIIYKDYIDKILDPIKRAVKSDHLSEIKEKYYVDQLIYVSDINILLSCYGLIKGVHKWYEPDNNPPHFEPIWSAFNNRDKFEAYVYPYQTEGIIFILDKMKICKWLKENHLIEVIPSSKARLFEFFLNLKENNPRAYSHLKTLLHTLSHILIRRSSIYTGLDEQSCGEMIFPSTNAFFIYSTSNINIGGFKYVFENEIWNWFQDIRFDIQECTLDPTCIHEKGACFACLYLPEFVCTMFNQFLDRDVFLGKYRFESRCWGW